MNRLAVLIGVVLVPLGLTLLSDSAMAVKDQRCTPFPDLAAARKVFDAHTGPTMYPSRIFQDPTRGWRDGEHIGWVKLVVVLKRFGWVPPTEINTDPDLARGLFYAHPGPPLHPAVIYDKPDDAWRYLYTCGDPSWARLITTLRRLGWTVP